MSNFHVIRFTRNGIRYLFLLALMSATTRAAAADSALAPGPERDGLRLRLAILPSERDDGGHEVQIDLLNVSQKDITLRTAWERQDTGSVPEYLEAATGIESYPPLEPWRGGLQATLPGQEPEQAEQVLEAGETLSVRWHAKGPELKNRVSDPFTAQNPTFDLPGLYSIHANLAVSTASGTTWLRSNEQQVSFGRSKQSPKHTYGPVHHMNPDKKTAILGLGAQHKVEVGDEFAITSKQAHWRLKVTAVQPQFSTTTLELVSSIGSPDSAIPPHAASATLVRK